VITSDDKAAATSDATTATQRATQTVTLNNKTCNGREKLIEGAITTDTASDNNN